MNKQIGICLAAGIVCGTGKAPNGLNRWFGGPNRFKLRLYKWLVVDLKAKRFKPLTNGLTTG